MIGRICSAAAIVTLGVATAASATPLVLAPPGSGGTIKRFDSATPAMRTPQSISAFGGGTMRGLDWRAASNELVWLTAQQGLDAVALRPNGTPVYRNAGADLTGTPPFESIYFFGVDVNPVVDRVRVVQSDDANYRLSADTGLVAGTDLTLTPAAGVTVDAVAYTPGTTTTTLYGIDIAGDRLVRIGGPAGAPSANGGAVTPIGPLGVDVNSNADFDIGQDGVAWANLNVPPAGSGLYRIDLATGAATLVGATELAEGLAVLPAGVVSLEPVAPITEGAPATVTLRRADGGFGAISVDVAVEPGSAAAGDLDTAGGRVTFAEGELTKTFAVATTGDADAEAAEDATVRLSNPLGGAVLGPASSAPLLIRDDDPAPQPAPVPPAPPAPAAVDTAAPVLLAVVPSGLRLRALRRAGVAVTVAASEACALTAELLAGTKVVGRRTRALKAAATTRLALKLSASGRRRVTKPRKLTLRLACADAAGNTARKSSSLRVRR